MDEQQKRDLAAEGERRRDIGMNRAAARRPDRVTLGRLAMLRALLWSADGCGTIDDATPQTEVVAKYADGGKWRGQVTRGLASDGFTEATGEYRRTRRPAAHRRPNAVWRLTDRQKAVEYLGSMTAALAAFNEATPPAATDGVAMTDTNKTTDERDLNSDKPK
jgi:hypothetical protein